MNPTPGTKETLKFLYGPVDGNPGDPTTTNVSPVVMNINPDDGRIEDVIVTMDDNNRGEAQEQGLDPMMTDASDKGRGGNTPNARGDIDHEESQE